MKDFRMICWAATFAAEKHGKEGQVRKYTGEPYIIHPARVAHTVAVYGGDSGMIQAAWLHDVLEDTDCTIDEIMQNFGPDVASLVDDLTDVSIPSDGNRATRKAIDRDHTSRASSRAKMVKLCDLMDNTSDILSNDLKFAETYLNEKRLLLEVLKGDGVCDVLISAAHNRLEDGLKYIQSEKDNGGFPK